ncbi:xanthine dehydrogenase family protein molybdopterin-binding subunit [Streptomyces sp. NPDC002523]
MTPPSVGTPRPRIEGRAKVTGTARYAADLPVPGLAYGHLVLAPVARGRVHTFDPTPALTRPGVLTVLHHGNAPHLKTDAISPLGAPRVLALFQHDRIPFAGWPVALVVAETREQAVAAAEFLHITYDETPHDVTFTPDDPAAHTPVTDPWVDPAAHKGDLESELAASAVTIDQWYSTPEHHHTPIEPHTATARWLGDRLEVTDSNQGTTWVARDLAALFSLPPATIRVRSEHIGGGFGAKGLGAQQVAAVMAATTLRRPVRVTLTHPQLPPLIGYRSPTAQRIRLGADHDGRLRALHHQSDSQTSTVHDFIEPSTAPTRVLYAAPAHHTIHRLLRRDVPTPAWMRAPGNAPGSFALESAMDELAETCRLDPIELRRRNEPTRGPVSALPFAGRALLACFDEGARRFGWADRDPRPRRRREGRWLLGTGTAAATYPADVAPSTATVTAHPDATFTVRIDAADIGTGARTALTSIAADALEVSPARIRIRIGDSDLGPAMFAGGSMGTRSWSWAVRQASASLRDQLTATPPNDVTVTADTTQAVHALPPAERHSFGAQFAEVAVDPATGEIRVRRLLGIYAAGTIVNPLTARGQLIGGMTWGLSMALHEEALRDGPHGTPVTGYHIATHADTPHIEADWLDDPLADDPVGIKGLGEIGVVGTAAALANALWHATGVRHRSLPLHPRRLLEPYG